MNVYEEYKDMIVRTGSKMYTCKKCEKSISTHWKRHLQCVHHICTRSECRAQLKKFNDMQSYDSHLLKVHGVKKRERKNKRKATQISMMTGGEYEPENQCKFKQESVVIGPVCKPVVIGQVCKPVVIGQVCEPPKVETYQDPLGNTEMLMEFLDDYQIDFIKL